MKTKYIEILVPSTHLEGMTNKGWGNGYVLLPFCHPYFGKSYGDIPVSVHGGLTFAETVNMYSSTFYMVGFDTAHLDDNETNCSLSYVAEQTKKLREQLEALA